MQSSPKLSIGIERGLMIKILINQELLTAWGTCRSTIVLLVLSPTIYKVRLVSRTRSVVLPIRVWYTRDRVWSEVSFTLFQIGFVRRPKLSRSQQFSVGFILCKLGWTNRFYIELQQSTNQNCFSAFDISTALFFFFLLIDITVDTMEKWKDRHDEHYKLVHVYILLL